MTAKTLSQLVGSGRPQIQEFTSSGVWTRPAGVNKITFLMCGGGGGGAHIITAGGARGGGGGGEILYGKIAVSGDITVTIGAGGAGAIATGGTSAGANGVATTISDGAYVEQSADFGNGAPGMAGAPGGGAGGITGTGHLSKVEGGLGGTGATPPGKNFLININGANDSGAGAGGSSIGVGGDGGRFPNIAGAGVKGGGGGAANGSSNSPTYDAGDGGDGFVYIMWIE